MIRKEIQSLIDEITVVLDSRIAPLIDRANGILDNHEIDEVSDVSYSQVSHCADALVEAEDAIEESIEHLKVALKIDYVNLP